jgi:exosortase
MESDGTSRGAKAEDAGLLQRTLWAFRGPERGAAVAGALALAALCALYAPALAHLVWTWSRDENYGHGFLVPLLSLCFANEAYRRGPIARDAGFGVLPLALLMVAVLGRIATTLVPIGIIGDLSFIAGLAGIVGMVAGRPALARFRFALGFLIFMVPLPIALYTLIASPLQRVVSLLASGILTAIGIPVLCQGNMMTLPGDVQLFVAEACSGMRQLTGFLALAAAVAWLAPRPAWYRWTLVASSVPIALAANVLRVTITAWMAYSVDPSLAGGWFHTVEGLLMMGVGLCMIAAECAILNGLVSARRGSAKPLPSMA